MACPVCFGGEDTVMRESLNAGIGVLMGVTAIVLAGFARFIILLARRSREAHLIEEVRLPPSRAERATASLAEAIGGGGKADTTVRVMH
jgi:hypothetical protein